MNQFEQIPEIRLGRNSDLVACQNIERSAGKIFSAWDMAEIAQDEPLSIAELTGYCNLQHLWVAVDESDHPIAYIIVDMVDDLPHIEQVSVHEDHSGKKIGRHLIEEVVAWANEQQMAALTLTTFRDIPWNAPYYERCGFVVIPEEQLRPGLKEVRAIEDRHGLNRWPRVCMERLL